MQHCLLLIINSVHKTIADFYGTDSQSVHGKQGPLSGPAKLSSILMALLWNRVGVVVLYIAACV